MLSTREADRAEKVTAMKPAELAAVRSDLLTPAGEMFASLPRSDQRRWGETYLRGLMLDGRRKSIEPMAVRLPDGDEQCLEQFVNQSPWEWEPVRERLARRMIAPLVVIVDDTGLLKAGRCSVGVARQYSSTLGKVGSRQIGVSLSAASDSGSCPLDWRLFLPQAWDEDAERRAKADLPADERHRPKWRLALEMLGELVAWGVEVPAVVADGIGVGIDPLWWTPEDRGPEVPERESRWARPSHPTRPSSAPRRSASCAAAASRRARSHVISASRRSRCATGCGRRRPTQASVRA